MSSQGSYLFAELTHRQAGFLRSSPKITLHPKPLKRGPGSLRQNSVTPSIQRLQSSSSPGSRTASPFRSPPVPVAAPPTYTGTWICPICSFSNPVPSNFDASNEAFPVPPCLNCGVNPPYTVVLKAAIAASVNRTPQSANTGVGKVNSRRPSNPTQPTSDAPERATCPVCTYDNHPSVAFCEICGTQLPKVYSNGIPATQPSNVRPQSPGPEISTLALDDMEEMTSVKFSFRAGGDKVFSDRLKSAMIQRKWLSSSAPPAPRPLDNLRTSETNTSGSSSPERSGTPKPSGVGIAGLEQRGLQSRKNNEAVIGTAFEDLEALMASAREIVALAEKFSNESGGLKDPSNLDPLLSQSAAAVGMVATKDMLSDSTNKLYISELARNLAEYVTDSQRGILIKQGGVMSLVDLWATFNRARNGVELISPSDFHKATEMWATLSLPVRLRQFKSGLLVVQQHDRSDEKTISQLKTWIHSLCQSSPPSLTSSSQGSSVEWDYATFSYGITAQDAAMKFGWSLGVATEELEMAEERGALCREEGVQGLRFWLNYIMDDV